MGAQFMWLCVCVCGSLDFCACISVLEYQIQSATHDLVHSDDCNLDDVNNNKHNRIIFGWCKHNNLNDYCVLYDMYVCVL